MKLLFDKPFVKKEGREYFNRGLNLTVRLGEKYRDLAIGEVLELESLHGDYLGSGIVRAVLITNIFYIPEEWMQLEHDPECRKVGSLCRSLSKSYNKNVTLSDLVVAIVFDIID